jgi:agmatine deiminase
VVRFASDKVIICAISEDETDPSYVSLRRNLERLQQLTSSDGAPYRVVPLPLPKQPVLLEGERVAASYANFYIGNGFVMVPMYNDENDQRALDILAPFFPGRKVIGLPSSHIATGGGSFHCITQQRPMGEVASG